jgi:hypothetical protein
MNNVLNNVFGHWESTVVGAALAAFQVVLNGNNKHEMGLAMAVAVFGAVVKNPGSK